MQNVLACTTETNFNNKRIDPLKVKLTPGRAGKKKDGLFQYCTAQMENHSKLFHPPPPNNIHIYFQTRVTFSRTITEGFLLDCMHYGGARPIIRHME